MNCSSMLWGRPTGWRQRSGSFCGCIHVQFQSNAGSLTLGLKGHLPTGGVVCTSHAPDSYPQVIEMTQVTAASDIWSVGCLIVEVLSGYPPYFELQPMSALFRIVQVWSRGRCSSDLKGNLVDSGVHG